MFPGMVSDNAGPFDMKGIILFVDGNNFYCYYPNNKNQYFYIIVSQKFVN